MNINRMWVSRFLLGCCILATVLAVAGMTMFGIHAVIKNEHQKFNLKLFCQLDPPQNVAEREQLRPQMEQCLYEATVAVINLNDQEAELLAEDPIDFDLVDRVNNAANDVMKVLVVLKEAEKKFFPPPGGQSLAKK